MWSTGSIRAKSQVDVAVAAVAAAAAAAAVMKTRLIRICLSEKELIIMGNSTGSMFYMVVVVIVIYLVGMLIFEGYRFFKKWRDKRRDRRFGDRKE